MEELSRKTSRVEAKLVSFAALPDQVQKIGKNLSGAENRLDSRLKAIEARLVALEAAFSVPAQGSAVLIQHPGPHHTHAFNGRDPNGGERFAEMTAPGQAGTH